MKMRSYRAKKCTYGGEIRYQLRTQCYTEWVWIWSFGCKVGFVLKTSIIILKKKKKCQQVSAILHRLPSFDASCYPFSQKWVKFVVASNSLMHYCVSYYIWTKGPRWSWIPHLIHILQMKRYVIYGGVVNLSNFGRQWPKEQFCEIISKSA